MKQHVASLIRQLELTLAQLKEYAGQQEKPFRRERELLKRYYHVPVNGESSNWLTTTEITYALKEVSGRSDLSTRLVGLSLRELGYKRVSKRFAAKSSQGYYVAANTIQDAEPS